MSINGLYSSTVSGMQAQDAYHNVNGLQQLKALDGGDKGASLDAISRQFESLLVHQMLKSMREANKVWSEGNFLSSNRVEFYQQMLDDQFSVELAGRSGFGFAERISEQLAGEHGEPDATAEQADNSVAQLRQFDGWVQRFVEGENPPAAADNSISQSVAERFSVDGDADSFIETLLPHAQRAAEKLGVPGEQILAQAALETGWGKHILKNDDGSSSHNLFGIKADGRWTGKKVAAITREYFDQREFKVSAQFRSYASLAEAFDDYVNFLTENPRYSAVQQSDSEFPVALQQAGYATDPHYASKIQRIAAQLNNTNTESAGALQ